MFNNFTFEYPYFLLLIVLFIICSIYCKAKSPSYFMPHLDIFNKVNQKSSQIMTLLKYFVIIFSIIALSSPVKINNTILLENDGINNHLMIVKDYLFFYPLFFAVISLILLIYLRNKE